MSIKCHPEDVSKLLKGFPYLTLGRASSALHFMKNMASDGDELSNILMQYPHVKYEPLDFYYLCFQSLGALNEELISDLITQYTWRELIFASWLIALSPSEKYEEYLNTIYTSARTENRWIIELALSEIRAEPCSCYLEHQGYLQIVKKLICQIKLPKIIIRSSPSGLANQGVIVEHLREAYRKGGVNLFQSCYKEVLVSK
jgi:hypothetical protein